MTDDAKPLFEIKVLSGEAVTLQALQADGSMGERLPLPPGLTVTVMRPPLDGVMFLGYGKTLTVVNRADIAPPDPEPEDGEDMFAEIEPPPGSRPHVQAVLWALAHRSGGTLQVTQEEIDHAYNHATDILCVPRSDVEGWTVVAEQLTAKHS